MSSKRIWVRLGGWVTADQQTAEAISAGDKEALIDAIKTNGFQPDGESYVPESEAEFDINPGEINLVTINNN